MSGFPRRPGLATFGPTLRDPIPLRNPETQVGADLLNLLKYQVAGLGLMGLRAWALIDSTGGVTPVIQARAESWNPDAKSSAPYTAPTPGRSGVGALTLAYAASYPDEKGNLVSTAITVPVAFAVNRSAVRDAAATVSGNTISVTLREFSAGAFNAVDGAVLVGFL